MRTIWGPVTEVRDLGVVAEQCPYCEQVMPCCLHPCAEAITSFS